MNINEIEPNKHYKTRKDNVVLSGQQIINLGKIRTKDFVAKLVWIMLMDQLSETDLPVTNPESKYGA